MKRPFDLQDDRGDKDVLMQASSSGASHSKAQHKPLRVAENQVSQIEKDVQLSR